MNKLVFYVEAPCGWFWPMAFAWLTLEHLRELCRYIVHIFLESLKLEHLNGRSCHDSRSRHPPVSKLRGLHLPKAKDSGFGNLCGSWF